MRKITVSLSDELDDALDSAAIAQGVSKSRLMDIYLHEHPVVRRYIEVIRAEPEVGVFAVSNKRRAESKKPQIVTKPSP